MKIKFSWKFLISILILCSVLNIYDLSWAKGKELLLFARNATFLPYIESTLRNLRDYETNEPIFSNIINLNKWSINRLETGNLDEMVRFYESSPELRKKSEFGIRSDKLLTQLIRQSDCYIRIDVLPKLSLLEFQLIITDSLPVVRENEFPIIVTNESRYVCFIIDISKEDFRYQLENSLKSFFPNTNRPPVPVVKLSKEKNEDGHYYFAVGSTAILDATESYDIDTPSEQLQFRWSQRNPNSDYKALPANEIIPIDISLKKQVIRFSSTGEYHFVLTVNDGIVDSKEEIIKIKVIDPPYLYAEPHYSIKSKGMFSDHKFRVSLSMITEQGQNTKLKVLPVSITYSRPLLFQKFLGKPEARTLDAAQYEVNCLSRIVHSDIESRIYELVIKEQSPGADFQYGFHIMAENNKCVSDTLDIKVDFQGRDVRFRGALVNFGFFGKPDDVQNKKRVIGFCWGLRLYLYKTLSFDFGILEPLFEEDMVDSLDIFHTPDTYLGLNWQSIYIPIYISSGKTGIGVGLDFWEFSGLLPLSFEVVKYGNSYGSVNIVGSYKSQFQWFVPAFIAAMVLTGLSVSK
jgi:hypothetical protein